MRDEWVADKYDLAKWSTLVHLAEAAKARSIVHIAFFRSSERPDLLKGEEARPVPSKVWKALRDLTHIKSALEETLDFDVRIFNEEFNPQDREIYLEECVGFTLAAPRPRIVLLDPDTGLQPNTLTAEHVSGAEVRELWSRLSTRDYLVLYQHARRDRTWRGDVRSDFESLIGMATTQEFFSPSIAEDVTFFAARKN